MTVAQAVEGTGMVFVPVIVEAQGAFGSGARDTLEKFVHHAHCNRGVDKSAFRLYWIRRLSATLIRGMSDAAAQRARALAGGHANSQPALPLGGHVLIDDDYHHYAVVGGVGARGRAAA